MKLAFFRCIPARISGTIGPYPVTTKRTIIQTSTSQSWSLVSCEKLENKQGAELPATRQSFCLISITIKELTRQKRLQKNICAIKLIGSQLFIFFIDSFYHQQHLEIASLKHYQSIFPFNCIFFNLYTSKSHQYCFVNVIICKKNILFIIGLIGFIIGFFFKEVYIIVIMMKSQKFIACFKSQKSLREGLLKEEFFEEVVDKIKEQLTQEEHEYLITFILQNKLRDKTTLNDNTATQFKVSPSPKNQESPLMHIREDVFKDVKKSLKRLVTLTQDTSVIQEQPRYAFTSTTRKRIKPRQHFHTIFTQQQNKMPKSALQNKRQENIKHFTISQRKKRKYIDPKSCNSILNNRKVLQAYDNNFLKDIFGVDECGFLNEFSERYLLTAPQPQEKPPLYAKLREKHKAEEDRYRSINQLQFDRTIGRNRTAIKLHSRKY